MASEQLRRDSKTEERDFPVEKDKVPKMKTHFESLTVKDLTKQPVTVTMHGRAGGINDPRETRNETMQKKEGEYKGPSLEEISKYRETTQQNSMDAILAAEEKYRKSKEMNSSREENENKSSFQKVKESVTQTTAENAARASDFAVVKGQQTKESLSSAAQTAAEKAVKAKDVVADKTSAVANTTVDVSKKSASYVGEKVVAAKDIAVETGKKTVGVVGKVACTVKDKALVTGWTAAGYASDKAVGVTETMANVTAGVAGFAGDTVVATKDVLADVGKKTKDMVVSTEESVKGYAARKKAEKQRELEAKNSKDEGEHGEEVDETRGLEDVAPDFKNRSLETNKGYSEWGSDQGYEGGFEHQGGDGIMEQGGFEPQMGGGAREEGCFDLPGGTLGERGFEHQRGGGMLEEGGAFEHRMGGPVVEEACLEHGGGGGIMRLIGETLVEIGQNTRDMFVGQGGVYDGEGRLCEIKEMFNR